MYKIYLYNCCSFLSSCTYIGLTDVIYCMPIAGFVTVLQLVPMYLFPFCLFRKEQIAEQREYKKKKAQKKVLRMKELEQEREEQKSKWQQFNNKAYSKNKKGQASFSSFYLKPVVFLRILLGSPGCSAFTAVNYISPWEHGLFKPGGDFCLRDHFL